MISINRKKRDDEQCYRSMLIKLTSLTFENNNLSFLVLHFFIHYNSTIEHFPLIFILNFIFQCFSIFQEPKIEKAKKNQLVFSPFVECIYF